MSGHIVYYTGQRMTRHEMDMKTRIGNNIDAALGERRNADIARATGKSEREIRRWRKGQVTPSEENLAALAAVANVSDLSWFYLPHEHEGAAA